MAKEVNWLTLDGTLVKGHQVASGRATNSPYSAGTIAMQIPFFQALGLDISHLFLGTLNVSIFPNTFELFQPQYTFRNVKWVEGYPPEDFSFSACQVIYNGSNYQSWVYYPHPETKIGHFQNPSVLEIIAPAIAGIAYDTPLKIKLNPQEILILTPT